MFKTHRDQIKEWCCVETKSRFAFFGRKLVRVRMRSDSEEKGSFIYNTKSKKDKERKLKQEVLDLLGRKVVGK